MKRQRCAPQPVSRRRTTPVDAGMMPAFARSSGAMQPAAPSMAQRQWMTAADG